EAAVELHDFGAVASEHQSGVEEAGKGRAPGAECVEGRTKDASRDLSLTRHPKRRDWRVRAHPTRVRAAITGQQTFVILHRRHGNEPLSISNREHGDFLTLHELLDEQLAPADAEGALDEYSFDGAIGVLERFANHNTLSGRETRRLDDDGSAELSDGAARALGVGERQGARRGHA